MSSEKKTGSTADELARSYQGGDTGIQFGGPVAAAGGPATHPTGVQYFAPWENLDSGFPEHCRRNALALSMCEPTQLYSLSPGRDSTGALSPLRYTDEFSKIEARMRGITDTPVGTAWARIYQVVPNEGLLMALTTHKYMSLSELKEFNRAKVAYIVLERDRVSNVMSTTLNKFGQVWTTCVKSAIALTRSGVNRDLLRIVPMPAPDGWSPPKLETRAPGPVRFYHIGKWEPRKAQDRLILAFARAFKPGEATLSIKTGSNFYPKTKNYPKSPAEAIARALEDDVVKANGWTVSNLESGFEVSTQRWPEAMIQALHRNRDFYCSFAHGEGWDMPAFDAVLAGTRVIMSCSGGPEQFVSRDAQHGNVVIPDNGLMVQSDPCYGWGDACYWDYNVEAAVTALRTAADQLHEPHETQDMSSYAPKAVGELMLSCLNKLRTV